MIVASKQISCVCFPCPTSMCPEHTAERNSTSGMRILYSWEMGSVEGAEIKKVLKRSHLCEVPLPVSPLSLRTHLKRSGILPHSSCSSLLHPDLLETLLPPASPDNKEHTARQSCQVRFNCF